MNIQEKNVNNILVIAISGDIDRSEEDKLVTFFEKIVKSNNSKIVLNISGLDYINSSILGILVKFYKEIKKKKGELCMSNVTPFVLNMLRITHINDIIKIYSVESDAIKSLEH